MPERFFCPELTDSTAELTDAEAHHAINVMRVKNGQTLQLFDGAGTTAVAVINGLTRRAVKLSIKSQTFEAQATCGLLTVAATPPKGDRLKWMIEKLTELGVHRYIPLRTARTVVDPRQSKMEKLNATVVSAAKQCGRDWLMEIAPTQKFDQLLNSIDDNTQVFLGHPAEGANGNVRLTNKNAVLFIGPEGGFTGDELTLAADRNVQKISRPGTILRTETAAIVLATLLTVPS